MTAGLLRLAGINMGENLDPDNNEDQAFLLHEGDIQLFRTPETAGPTVDALKTLVRQRNESHAIWGWKDPISVMYLPHLLDSLRHPHFLFVARDIAASAFRERIEGIGLSHTDSPDAYMLDKMKMANTLQDQAIELAQQTAYALDVAIRYGPLKPKCLVQRA